MIASMNVASSKVVASRTMARGALVSKPPLVTSRVSIVRSMREDRSSLGKARSERRDVRMLSMAGAGSGMSPELKRSVDEFVTSNKVVVFMKGTKQAPQKCGFSAKVVQILSAMEVNFETVNILEDERLRSGMKEYSQWPTFPQVYINGEFYGGADITLEAAQNGQLKEALEVAFLE